MTEVLQHPSAVWRSGNGSFMIPETVDSSKPIITSESFDMGYAGQKMVSTVESDAMVVDSPEANIDYTHDNNSWNATSFKPINNQGITSVIASGNSFRASIRFADIYNNTRISYIKVRYKMTDLRGLRGVYAPSTSLRGQGA